MIHTLLLVVVFLGLGNKPKAQFTILHKNSLFCFFVCAKINTFATHIVTPVYTCMPLLAKHKQGHTPKTTNTHLST